MSLFSRLFSPRKTKKKEKPTCSSDQSPIKELKSDTHSLEKNDVRVLLFRECDWRGRKLLFDSTSVEKVLLEPKTPLIRSRCDSADTIVEISKGYGFKYKKPHADTNTLGETIFGSIAMATRGPSLKIHQLKDPSRLMFTKVIQAPRSGVRKRQISDDKTLDESQGSSINSMGEYYNSGSSDSKQGSFETTLNDSGFGGGRESLSCDWSKHPSPQSCCCTNHCPLHSLSLDGRDQANSNSSLASGSSLSSLRRRWARSVATTLDFTDPCQPPPPVGKRTKLGVALIIPLMPIKSQEMEQFLLDRLPLVNNILNRLQHSTETAYCRRDVFVQSMVQASAHATQSVYELVCGSRLDRPVWLTLTSDHTDSQTRAELTSRLVSDLSHLLATLDTKHTNFFISTLLTAVLTHHLGWVPTVFTDLQAQSNTMLADLSRNHPYNPLWAQLTDLQGALGYPPKVARTVVVGRSEVLVHKLLSILSYFIRCGHVSVTNLQREVPPDEEAQLEYLLENEQEKSSFDKDAIREFSKASIGTSTSTLTKSKTVLSLKTFSVTDCDMDNANSLESGFESCNEFSGESYEDKSKIKPFQNPSCMLGKSKSYTKLMETSFSQDAISNFNVVDESVTKISPFISPSNLSMVTLFESNKSISKIEDEKQFTSSNFFNRVNSKQSVRSNESRHNFFIKENVLDPNTAEVEYKESKVVFVLGENEELVNIKSQNEAHLPENILGSAEEVRSTVADFEPPIILINDIDEQGSDREGERCKTENKTDFVGGGVDSRVVIVRSTPIELEGSSDSRTLTSNPLHRCLSVPEEAVSETDWAKSRRSKEAVQLIRKWLSDSAIERVSQRPLCGLSGSENAINMSYSAPPASVFRTSNRSLKDASLKLGAGQSVQHILSKVGCEVPSVAIEDVDFQPFRPEEAYIELHSQSCSSVEVDSREVGVAASLFGAVSDVYSPELVLQGVTQVPGAELQQTLLLEAHAGDLGSELAEAVCILANTDTWEVMLVSSHSVMGVRVGMSQLVASMLETTQHLCSLSLPAHLCLSHVETKLFELCVRSQALAELLLASDFLDMASLTSALDLDSNDVPLLLSVASTHTPLVTRKYGLSFQ